ncbi:uncharacterized protein Dwil_GK14959 [Drosophila willistoni]|uniref:RNA-binding protein 5-A n=2 Tax=Drosophila willistoni TaxID=7260 RepID=B4MW15_DROWI|nr:uncharacterized protein Dwil_GK14959 [Drosophila willistoni]
MDSRYGRSFSGGSNNNSNQYRRYSRSRSRSRERSREHAGYRRRQSRSRSRDRFSHYRRDGSTEQDLYRDLIDDDYKKEGNYNSRNNNYDHRQHRRDDNYDRRDDNYDRRDDNYDNERDQRWKNYDREPRERNMDYDRGNDRGSRSGGSNNMNNNNQNNGNGNNRERRDSRRYSSDEDSYMSDDSQYRRKHTRTSNEALNIIIIFGLKKHVTEADIWAALIQVNMEPACIRVIRKQPTGASRGFAFVEFNTVEEARHWMEITQGSLQLGDQRVSLQYSHKRGTDWNCVKCGACNFKRRFYCFMCSSSRTESEGVGEGADEISHILTKKIMLRNLDALTNEEGVLTALQKFVPQLAKTVSKVLISRDTLTQASRGICYLYFETLIDSMNVYNGLTALDPPLTIDERNVGISYSIDFENRQIGPKDVPTAASSGNLPSTGNVDLSAVPPSGAGGTYTLADVPRLAEYSASLYASNPAEKAHYVQYYRDYYTSEIAKGNMGDSQLTEANSGAAVALSAIQRQQKKLNSIETTATSAASAAAQAAAVAKASFAATTSTAANLNTPKGNDGKIYPTPDVSRYQYDETSGYYYDPSTGLYYDAHSQYYYNNETGAYLYWDQRRSTYILATPASTQAALKEVLAQEPQPEAREDDTNAKKEKSKDKETGFKHDKVKVAKKIVKDMEKWAKQLNQKKDYTVVATPQPILGTAGTSIPTDGPSTSRAAAHSSGGYADVGFSILEKKERAKLSDFVAPTAPGGMNKLVNAYGGGSDSEEDNSSANQATSVGGGANGPIDEMDYVDFKKLTCLLCKRAFQSLDILQKHLKMSNLHKENLAKLNQNSAGSGDDAAGGGLSYRDRAKERRLKYGESDPPPPNRSRERFEIEMKQMQTRQKDNNPAPAMPISSSNVGSRLLQKMGWSEGQGLGRKNQGRTQIIEAEARSNNVGLGNKAGQFAPGNDYKTYIKKMMKQRYENA